jgi:hypothetical protein
VNDFRILKFIVTDCKTTKTHVSLLLVQAEASSIKVSEFTLLLANSFRNFALISDILQILIRKKDERALSRSARLPSDSEETEHRLAILN